MNRRRTKAQVALIATQRRDELRMTTAELAAAANVDFNTVRDFIAGKRKPTQATRVKLNDALQWKPGSLHRLYEGGDAEPLDAPPVPLIRSVSDDELLAEVGWRLKMLRTAADELQAAAADAAPRFTAAVDNPRESG